MNNNDRNNNSDSSVKSKGNKFHLTCGVMAILWLLNAALLFCKNFTTCLGANFHREVVL